jgi:hypothetical protein
VLRSVSLGYVSYTGGLLIGLIGEAPLCGPAFGSGFAQRRCLFGGRMHCAKGDTWVMHQPREGNSMWGNGWRRAEGGGGNSKHDATTLRGV